MEKTTKWQIEHLSDKAIFRHEVEASSKTPGRIAAIIAVLEGMDRLDQIREQLDRESLLAKSKRGLASAG